MLADIKTSKRTTGCDFRRSCRWNTFCLSQFLLISLKSIWYLSLLFWFSCILMQIEFWLFTARIYCTNKSTCHLEILTARRYWGPYVTSLVHCGIAEKWEGLLVPCVVISLSNVVLAWLEHQSSFSWFLEPMSFFFLIPDHIWPVRTQEKCLQRTKVYFKLNTNNVELVLTERLTYPGKFGVKMILL